MPKITVDVDNVMETVFPGTSAPEDFTPQTKTTYYDEAGNEVLPPEKEGWIARVSSMSLSIKVTPKIGDTYISIERALTVDLNTHDKKIVQEVWTDLQKQVVGGVFNTLSIVSKQISEVKKG